MAFKRAFLVPAAIMFAMLLSAYIFSRDVVRSLVGGGKLSAAECTDAAAAQTTSQNPNKMLFISCGGFLD